MDDTCNTYLMYVRAIRKYAQEDHDRIIRDMGPLRDAHELMTRAALVDIITTVIERLEWLERMMEEETDGKEGQA